MRSIYLRTTSILAFGLTAGTAFAQTAPPEDPADPTEIIVTANKRAQSINRVGMAITALTDQQLRSQNISSVSGLSKIEPSFVAAQSKYGAPTYTIRGIGYNDFALAASPTVSVYVDEVPYAYPAQSKAATLDLERVEILKGPQGTLYGQNATGGAVNYIAAKPTTDTRFGIEATYGSYGAFNAKGFVSGSITDTLRARLSAETDQGGAFQRSITFGDRLGDRNFTRARLLLNWEPDDRWKVAINLNGFRDRSEAQPAQATGITPQLTTRYPNVASADPALRNRLYSDIVGLTALPFPTSAKQAEWYHGVDPRLDQTYYQASIRTDFTVSDNLTLTWLGAVDHYRQDDILVTSGRQQPSYYGTHGRITSTTQELRASGKLFEDRLDYVLGATYAYARSRESNLLYYQGITTAYSTIALPLLAGLTTAPTAPASGAILEGRTDANTYALFGNLEYHFSDRLSVHGGARYTISHQDYAGCGRDNGDGVLAQGFTALQVLRGITPVTVLRPGDCVTLRPDRTPGLYEDKLNQNNVAWRIGVDWHPAARTLIYATVSKGYKAGSFPVNAASSFVSLSPVVQESVLAYEIGAKTRLFDNLVDIEGAIFYYDYRNKQLASNRPDTLGVFGILNALVNVPKSAEKGAELSVRFHPVGGLTLSAQATYLDSYVRGSFLSFDQFSTVPIDLHGEPFPNTPKWALVGGLSYEFDVNGDVKADVGGNVRYQSRATGAFGTQVSIDRGFPSLYIKDYAVLDLRAGISSASERWYAQVFAENVTNSYYWTQTARIFDGTVRFAGRPRTFGLKLGYRY